MSKIFFTSDHHFGHHNIIKYSNRPFKDIDEMDAVMIERWNEKVSRQDIVYHLGDFAMSKDALRVGDILRQLNGNIHLIKGNHESSALQHKEKFQWIKDYYELKVKDSDCDNGVRRIILFHYAMRVWRSDFRGTWQLYGHSHGNLPDKENRLAFDIGVDCHDYYPLSYEEVKAIMKTKKWEPPFKDREPEKKKEKPNTAPEHIQALQKIISEYVTDERLNQVVDKMNDGRDDFSKILGAFSKDIVTDFTKDNEDKIIDLEKNEIKMITKSFVKKASDMIHTTLRQ